MAYTVSSPRLRRLALAAQGLSQKSPFGRGLGAAHKAIEHIGYVQIDTISVVERAHHHVWFARVENFTPQMLNQLLAKRHIFEYWSHAAAFLPMRDFRFSLPYKQAIKNGKVHWHRDSNRKLMGELYRRIEQEGPLRSRDIEDQRGNAAGWWDWKPAKKALEQLYMEGDLMVSDRSGFQKTYDLTERVLPSDVNTTVPTYTEFAAHLLDQVLRCHGFATLKGITYLRRNAALRRAVKTEVELRLAEDRLLELRLPDGSAAVCLPELMDAATPRVAAKVKVLSPFDNLVIQRERLATLFNFDYQIECYVPEAKRMHGYFCLPLLYRDCFVGRMDCKAHRRERKLVINHLSLEDHGHDDDEVFTALALALPQFAAFQGCETWQLARTSPTHKHALAQRWLN